jgi:hypothetical protein
MITDELISYIKNQLKNGNSEELIKQRLLNVGWILSDIDEGFSSVLSAIKEEQMNKKIDPYRELTEEDEEDFLAKKRKEIEENIKKKIEEDTPFVWTPVKIKPVTEESFPSKEDSPRVFMTASSFREKKEEISIPSTPVEGVLFAPKDDNTPFIKEKEPVKLNNINNFDGISKKFIPEQKISTPVISDSLDKKEIPEKSKHKTALVMSIFLVLLVLIGALTFVLMKGYIKSDWLNISFIKKDPKVLILNNSQKLSSLDSYKTETLINISAPTFADISNSIISGQDMFSADRDSISVKAMGIMSKKNESTLYDSLITTRSSILENPIITNIKSSDSTVFVSIPDLSELMGKKSPSQMVVQIKEEEKGILASLLEEEIGIISKDIDLYKILSGGFSSYITKDSLSKYDNFINTISIVEKEKEIIKGVETYHYDINTNKESSRDLVKEIAKNFINSEIDSVEKERINNMLGSLSINSFEVWIGKNDNNIYQYKIELKVPLSKVLAFEDSSLGNSEVLIDWTTTYYDFNISNEIILPQDFYSLDYFGKSFRNIKLKNEISELSSLFKTYSNATGNFGKISNKGNCVNPTSGSIFSPTGHTKNASLVVGDIALKMNDILNRTNSIGFCYSDSKSWAVSVPLESEFQSYFCLDNTGVSNILTTELNSTKCGIQ